MQEFENRTGTYALVFTCNKTRAVEIGKLGTLNVQPGYYIYIGSAFGPGGIKGRVGHHLRQQPRAHWHVDYLKPHCSLLEIWIEYSDHKHEVQWARSLSECKNTATPMNGFGASDTAAASHLFYLKTRPEPRLLAIIRPRVYKSAGR